MIVSALSGVVVILLGLLFFVLNTNSKNPVKDPSEAWAAQPTNVDILVSRAQIEQGMLIEPALLTSQSFPREAVPIGAILETNRQSVLGKFAKQMIPTGALVQEELISEQMPLSSETIPPGMRAVTINLDSRAGVAGHVKPFSRVDVLCTYDNKGSKEIAVVVPYAKVFSVNGNTGPTNQTAVGNQEMSTVTLVVREEDALRIELARAVGALSLNLVGNTTVVSNTASTSPISQKHLFTPKDPEVVESVKIFGRSTIKRDGRTVTFILTDKGWQEEKSGDLQTPNA
jgi:pilus assembly protein CpaB